MEGDGIVETPITVRVKLESKGDSFVADFTESDDSCQGPLNCRWPSVAACVYYVLKACLDPELPPNAGAYRPVEVIVREGSLLSALYPTAVCNANIITTTQRITDALLGRARARHSRQGAGSLLRHHEPAQHRRHRPAQRHLLQLHRDLRRRPGALCTTPTGWTPSRNHMTNTRNAPVEAIELCLSPARGEIRPRAQQRGSGTAQGRSRHPATPARSWRERHPHAQLRPRKSESLGPSSVARAPTDPHV